MTKSHDFKNWYIFCGFSPSKIGIKWIAVSKDSLTGLIILIGFKMGFLSFIINDVSRTFIYLFLLRDLVDGIFCGLSGRTIRLGL